MSVPGTSDSQRWVDGSLESGADPGPERSVGRQPDVAGPSSSGDSSGGPGDDTGVGVGTAPPSTFEPEEDGG